MPKPLSKPTIEFLRFLDNNQGKLLHELNTAYKQSKSPKAIYDMLYRLQSSGLVELKGNRYHITPEGQALIHRKIPVRDGSWKIIVFDIPEQQRQIRNFLRQRLVELGFKKWQNSIWVSPYKLEPELEAELKQLATKYFVRLIKSSDINHTKDLEQLFPENK